MAISLGRTASNRGEQPVDDGGYYGARQTAIREADARATQARYDELAQRGGMTPSSPTGGGESYGSGAGGAGYISRPAYEQQQQATLDNQSALARMQEQSRLDALALRDRAALNDATFTKRLGQLSTSGASASRVEGSPIAGNEAAARSAAFARAKDRAGQTALASLTALQNVMGQRGMLGSSEEARLTQGGLQGGADVLNEFTRDELMSDLDRAAELSDRTYAGDITQRGQDLSARQSLLALMTSAGLY